MNQYFFKMDREEKENILDQHKSLYDGFVTLYNQPSNTQPLYTQSYANDKGGLVVNNKGNVKLYTNMKINESHLMNDKIADGPHDLINGTVDFRGTPDMSDVNREYFGDFYPSPNENEIDFVSIGMSGNNDECKNCDEDNLDIVVDVDVPDYNYQEEETPEFEPDYTIYDDVEEENIDEFSNELNESLNMFKRLIK